MIREKNSKRLRVILPAKIPSRGRRENEKVRKKRRKEEEEEES